MFLKSATPPLRWCFVGLLMMLALAEARANIIINGTRVIYPETEREVSVRLSNKGARPSLVQAWLDDGRPNASPDEVLAPFTILPPIAKVPAGGSQVMRLSYTGDPLADDVETVFWLNILDVAPADSPITVEDAENDSLPGTYAAGNQLQLAFRSRIKLFFRPKSVLGSIDPLKASSMLQWTALQENGALVLRAKNPTPFHLTVATLQVQAGEQSFKSESATKSDEMIAPFGSMDFTLEPGAAAAGGEKRIKIQTINDFGGLNINEFPFP